MANEFEDAINRKFANEKIEIVPTEEAEFQEEQPEVVKEEKKPEAPTEQKAEDKVVLSNTDNKKPEEVKAEVVKTDTKVPTFEETLAERTGGKFKDWTEIEAKLNEPKIEFADEQIKKINDYRKGGGKIDKNWLYLQTVDLDKLDNEDLITQ